MKARVFLAITAVLMFLTLTIIQSKSSAQNSIPEESNVKPKKVRDITYNQIRLKKEETFKKGRKLLVDYGVPFEPNELLDVENKEKIIADLSTESSFNYAEVLGSEVEGVSIHDTVYIPSKLKIKGNTVIIARNVIFEGKDVIIEGPHDVHIFPLEKVGMLGITIAEALKINGHRYVRSGFSKNPIPKFDSTDLELINDGSLTIDLHGLGRNDWLKQQKSKVRNTSLLYLPNSFNSYILAGYQPSSSNNYNINTLQDSSGIYGGTGSDGTIGATGVTGDTGGPGTQGDCGGDKNGGRGEDGKPGGPGGTGNIGGTGGTGGPGGNLTLIFPDNYTTQINATTMGGTGGTGGIGGPGGPGGPSGDGGPGGDGANCGCTAGLGIGGTGGNGKNGGPGGLGGQGGQGGDGGPAGNITISIPFSYPLTPNANVGGGPKGLGGQGGPGGYGGNYGKGGSKGSGATNISCSPSGANDGQKGSDGNPGGSLGGGPPGLIAINAGTSGTANIERRPRVCTVDEEQTCDDLCKDINPDTCECVNRPPGECGSPQAGCNCSPIILDIDGNNFSLTSASDGVLFDLNGDGMKNSRLAWTSKNSDDAWLVLDRNSNGLIENGSELFGNYTPQPISNNPNGFIALAEYDKPANGGNGDGKIDSSDSIFVSLRLWQDKNQNAVSEPGELHTLTSLGVKSIELDYKKAARRDRYGNRFTYRAKANREPGARLGPWAYDVFIQATNP